MDNDDPAEAIRREVYERRHEGNHSLTGILAGARPGEGGRQLTADRSFFELAAPGTVASKFSEMSAGGWA